MTDQRTIRIVDALCIVIVAAVTITELPLVHEGGQSWYAGARVLMLLALGAHLLLSRYNERVWYGVSWASVMYAYTIQGEYFRPLYIISLFQIQMVHAFYFAHTRRSYVVTTVGAAAAFLAMLAYAWDENLLRLHQSNVADQATIAFCSTSTAMILFFQVQRLKARSERMIKKLALVGNYATSLIHDLKNLNAGPLLYSAALSDRSQARTPEQQAKLAELLNDDLKKVAFLVRELYNTSQLQSGDREVCSLRALCTLTQEIMGTRLEGIRLEIDGDANVKTDKRVLQVILLNLFYNSITALKALSNETPKRILITLANHSLTFSSNSVGEKSANAESGLGLFLMQDLGSQAGIVLVHKSDDRNWETLLSFS